MSKFITLFIALLALSACSEVELASHIGKKVFPPPKSQGTFKVGNPYKIKGRTYYPRESYDLVETGIASWYGPQFHGKQTANGEIFDMNELTAAHRTLQLPSLVRVTNLENGLSLIVRVNDRGPYKRGRVIDLSRRASELLGFREQGTAKVRLQVLKEESLAIAQVAKSGKDTSGFEVALNNGYKLKPKTQPVSLASSESTASREAKPSIEPVVQEEISGVSMKARVPGHMKDGDFYPSPIVSEMPVTPTNIYVQAGAFTVEDNAYRLSRQLSVIAPTDVYPAVVNGRQFYRVRLGPMKTVALADNVLARLADSGNSEAIIVVD